MATTETSELPTNGQLLRATATAIVIASVLLVAVVWPAEYGRDPTGVGARLGLLRRVPEAEAEIPAAPLAPGTVVSAGAALLKSPTPFRTDEMSVVLAAGEGAEIKALMAQGERFVFSWVAQGGSVDVDMHGEPAGGGEGEFKSYWKEEAQASGHGAFEAPVAGTHGWFWQNLGSEPVTVTVKTSGFYQKLFRP